MLDLWAQAEAAGKDAVLATVVKTFGSSYRLPGARLLLTQYGVRAGSISGGCLEEDLIKKAWWLTENGPMIRRYDTTPDGEIAPTYGLGCNGIIHVLVERVQPGHAPVFKLISDVRQQRRPAAIAHLIQPEQAAGQRLIVDTNATVGANIADKAIASRLESEAKGALADRRSRVVSLHDGGEAFVEVLAPPIHLLVFGAGDDAIPVTRLARFAGWRVSVFDGRAHYARREKFPDANDVVRRPAGDLAGIGMDAWTVALLMSHSYSQDLENLGKLASQPLRYLGILGPSKRTEQLLADAQLETSVRPAELYGPMGLDIGADGPEQVALSVVAEIQAVLNGRPGGFLRDRSGSIHSSDSASRDSNKLWAQSTVCA